MALPPDGPGYRVLKLGRRRSFGHPALVAYVRRLGAAVARRKIGVLMVGDLAQPRGGPTPTGHRSHQTGLDVDVWYVHPPWATRRKPTRAERETLTAPAVVDLAARTVTPPWTPRIVDLLALAAADPEVDRVFVHAAVKREACGRAAGQPWLRKLRPWYGHHDHFHVRLRCPADSPGCAPQEPLPEDDGCGPALAWWFGDEPRAAAERRRDEPPVPLPEACQALLDAAAPAGQRTSTAKSSIPQDSSAVD